MSETSLTLTWFCQRPSNQNTTKRVPPSAHGSRHLLSHTHLRPASGPASLSSRRARRSAAGCRRAPESVEVAPFHRPAPLPGRPSCRPVAALVWYFCTGCNAPTLLKTQKLGLRMREHFFLSRKSNKNCLSVGWQGSKVHTLRTFVAS